MRITIGILMAFLTIESTAFAKDCDDLHRSYSREFKVYVQGDLAEGYGWKDFKTHSKNSSAWELMVKYEKEAKENGCDSHLTLDMENTIRKFFPEAGM